MKTRQLLLIPVFSLLLSSCVTPYFVSDTPREQINELTILEPASYIELIEKGKGNRTVYNDSLTKVAEVNLKEGLQEHLNRRYIVHTLNYDEQTKMLIDHQLQEMIYLITIRKKNQPVPIPPSIDSVMAAHDIDYALCAVHYGFTREKGNYGAQVAKGVLIGVLTLGNYYTVPVKAYSELSIVIIDRRRQEIAFHNKSSLQDAEPIDKSETDHQIRMLFEKYFMEL